MDAEDAKELMEMVEEITKCPVCLDPVESPVSLCRNGHPTCAPCRKPLRECSICREPFTQTSALVLEQLMEVLPKPCPYIVHGCNAVTVLDSHTKICKFRRIRCRVGQNESCNWSGFMSNWEAHIVANHPMFFVSYNSFNEKTLNYTDFPNNWYSTGGVHKVDNNLFLIYSWKKDGEFHHTVRHVLSQKITSEYYFRITFRDGKTIVYRGVVKASPLLENETVKSDSVFVFLKDVHRLMKRDGVIKVTFEAIKEKKSYNVSFKK